MEKLFYNQDDVFTALTREYWKGWLIGFLLGATTMFLGLFAAGTYMGLD